MKKVLKNRIFQFIIIAIIFTSIGVVATNSINASNVSYKGEKLDKALDTLYQRSTYTEYNGSVNITPSSSIQTLPTDNKILKANITINPIPSNYKELSTLTNELTSSDLLSGKQGYKADGTVVTGNIATFTPESSYTPTTTEQTLSTNGKYVTGNIIINAISNNNSNDNFIYIQLDSRITNSWAQVNSADTNIYTNSEYFTTDGMNMILKKDCKIKISAILKKPKSTTTSSPSYRIYNNNTLLLSGNVAYNNTTNTTTRNNVTINAKAGDIITKQIYGASDAPGILVTYIELVEE